MKKIDKPFVHREAAGDCIFVRIPRGGYLVVDQHVGSQEPLLVFKDMAGEPELDRRASHTESPLELTDRRDTDVHGGDAGNVHTLMMRTFSTTYRIVYSVAAPGEVPGVYSADGERSVATHPLDDREAPPTREDVQRWLKYGLLPEDPKQDYEPDTTNGGGWVL